MHRQYVCGLKNKVYVYAKTFTCNGKAHITDVHLHKFFTCLNINETCLNYWYTKSNYEMPFSTITQSDLLSRKKRKTPFMHPILLSPYLWWSNPSSMTLLICETNRVFSELRSFIWLSWSFKKYHDSTTPFCILRLTSSCSGPGPSIPPAKRQRYIALVLISIQTILVNCISYMRKNLCN